MEQRHSRRSPFGDNDQIGAMNHVTPAMLARLFQGVRQGRVFDLGHVLEMGAPRIEPFQSPYVINLWTTPERCRKLLREHMNATNEAGVLLERVEMTMHVGTHIDALGHFTIGDEMFNGFSAEESVGDWGLNRLGMEQAPPIITRAVIIDVAGYKGVDYLEGGTVITPADMEGALRRQGSSIQTGDSVLLHTGWSRFFMVDNAKYVATEPGIGDAGARWLTAQKVASVGSDTMAVEVTPMEKPNMVFPVHQHLLVEAGTYIIENLRLNEPLAAGVYEFLFILLPVKYKGATASPVRPVGVI